jgi:beta-aspartyl-peptidase (threonine type)
VKPAILVHGGAGPAAPDDEAVACEAGCQKAARAGYEVLRSGGSSLDAVVAAAVVLEDDPLFNAGTGGALTADGVVELDASVMVGESRAAGAVACVRDIKNPIRLARAVMEKTRHVLLAGEGASRLADEVGIPRVDPGSLVTDRARRRLHGTIGAVAIDERGHVAAATSTGGTSHKRAGRIGDSPLIGAGTYADDRAGAVSMTGTGEVIIRVVAAKFACDALRQGASARQAADRTVEELARVGGDGGLILIDGQGHLSFAFNTARMSRAWIDGAGAEGSGFG